MNMTEVLICEYFVAGGEDDFNAQIACEGLAVLTTLIDSFNKAGYDVVTILRKDLSWIKEVIPARTIAIVNNSRDFWGKFKEMVEKCELVAVMAPESNNILPTLAQIAKSCGAKFLGPDIRAIYVGADKLETLLLAKKLGLPVPQTVPISKDEGERIRNIIKDIGLPVVVKPKFGVGCEDTYLVKNERDIDACIRLMKKSRHEEFLVQEYVLGADASVSLISNGSTCMPLTLNKQIINLSSPTSEEESTYGGGFSPFLHEKMTEALNASKKIVERVPGFYGYIGIDFVLTSESAYLMEINPRFTTSIVGISRILLRNISTLLIESVIERKLPKVIEVRGVARYLKTRIKIPRSTYHCLCNLAFREDLPCPPMPTSLQCNATMRQEMYTFVLAVGASLETASQRLEASRRELERGVIE